MLIGVELRKSLPVFGVALLMMGVPRILTLVSDQQIFEVLYGLGSMLSWVTVVVYLCYRIFAYYCLGHDVFLHITSLSRRTILARKAIVLGGLMIVLGLLTLGMDASLYTAPEHLTATDWVYLAIARTISIVAFVGLALAATTLVKFIEKKAPMTIAYAAVLAAICVAAGFAFWNVGAANNSEFFLGVSDKYSSAPAYAVIIPFFGLGREEFVTDLSVVSSIGNALIAVITLGFWWVLSRDPKANFFRL